MSEKYIRVNELANTSEIAIDVKKSDGNITGAPTDATIGIKTWGHPKIVSEFTLRSQELTDIVRRISNGSLVEESELSAFSLELANYHSVQADRLCAFFKTDIGTGLKQQSVDVQLSKDGMNILPKADSRPLWLTFLYCFTSGFAPLLWIAFAVVFITYIPFGVPPSNIYNLALAMALLAVIFISGIFTFFQEVTSTLALAAFSNMVPPKSLVIRDGKSREISPEQLVVGDVIILETGMKIPSDVRIVSASDLKVDTSMLTGENEPVKLFADVVPSTTPMLQSRNMGFMGCNVVEGQGVGIIIATGRNNQLAKIAKQVGQVTTLLTSLQIELNRFVIFIGAIALFTSTVCILEWNFYLDKQHNGFMSVDILICNAVSVLVAFVPEGLPLALQTGLTIIANRLCAKHKILIKQLSIIETMGSMTMLASDKTGTLTQNNMVVTDIITSDRIYRSSNTKDLNDNQYVSLLFTIAVRCNQSKLKDAEGSNPSFDMSGKKVRNAVGSNGIDRALLNWAEGAGKIEDIYSNSFIQLLTPFSSTTKTSTGVVSIQDRYYVVVKGAPEYILNSCGQYMDETTGELRTMSQDVTERILSNISLSASSGKRVIALAQLYLSPQQFSGFYSGNSVFSADPVPNFPVTGLTFMGCIAVSDPPRDGVKETIDELRVAGIAVAMVTGDAVNTAVAIAKQVGIISDETATDKNIDNLRDFNSDEKIHTENILRGGSVSKNDIESLGMKSNDFNAPKSVSMVIDGKDLAFVTDKGWDFIYSHKELVFARTTPEQKLQIIIESQNRGFRVGVTGDGVNDSPALKRADVGIAMGNGSDVAKDAANIILLNDNFSSISHAVLEGRLIFANLRRVIGYQIAAGCWSELLPVLATFFFGMPQPLSTFLMIIISCSTDVLAGIALMNEPPETSLMKEKPRNIHTDHIVNWKLICYSYLWYGSLQSVGSFINYFIYMAERGNTRSVSTPVPVDYFGTNEAPFGFRAVQLIGAWNWLTGDTENILYKEETNAANAASSVFFLTLVVCQMGHLLSIRKKAPYFSEIYLNTEGTIWSRFYDKLISIRPIPRIILAWIGSAIIINIFTYIPAVQVACGTGPVPGLNWGIAIGWAALVFCIDQVRKWIILIYPESWVGKISWEINQ